MKDMAGDELAEFRESWKQELSSQTGEQRPDGVVPGQSGHRDSKNRYFEDLISLNKACGPEEDGCAEEDEGCTAGGGGEAEAGSEEQPEYVSIARGLLDGRTGPLLHRIEEDRTRRKRQFHSRTGFCSSAPKQQQQQPQRKVKKELVDQLIQDLNEVEDIPFFDVELPYELASKIFQYLNCTELGRCAQVSRAWRVLAEDGVLWFRMCTGAGYHQDASVSDSPCWKSTLRDCRNSAKTVRSNWKNRVGSISQLQFELGKVLCDVSSCDNFVFAGYTSGDVRLWDTLHWDSNASYLKPNGLSANTEPRPHVLHVQVNSTVAAAAYEDGRQPGHGARPGSPGPAGRSGSRRLRAPARPTRRKAADAPLSLRTSCHVPGRLRLPRRSRGEALGLVNARRRKQDPHLQPGDGQVRRVRGQLAGRLHLHQPEGLRSSPAGVWKQGQEGEGLRPAGRRLLRGVPVRPPPGRDLGAGGRLEDREWRRRGTGVRVGAADGSEAVGDAQPASRQACTLQHQHPGYSQHPRRQVTAGGLHHRR